MDQRTVSHQDVQVSVENVGGIDETTVEFAPGVTILTGRNATNRTSFLRSIMAALGSDAVSLKGDAEEGRADLSIGEETYTRSLTRGSDGGVVTGGAPYLEDATLADLFAFLLESNDARKAVERGDDLRDLIMRPVDTDEIQAAIQELEAEKRSIDESLSELADLDRERSDLEARRSTLTREIEETEESLEEKYAEIDAVDREVGDARSETAELEDTIAELGDVRSELESVRHRLDTERESLENLSDEREDLEGELDALAETPAGELGEIEPRMDDLRERKRRLDSAVNDLQRIIRFNEDLLEGQNEALTSHLRDDEGDLTDRLLDDDGVVCWTCGSSVERADVDGTLERLRDVRADVLDERNAVRDDLEGLKADRAELREHEQRRESLRRRLDRAIEEIDRRESRIEDLTDRREALASNVERLETELNSLDVGDEYGAVLALHREANQLEFELDRLRTALSTAEEELAAIEDRLDERETLEERRQTVGDELADRRTQIDRIEREAVEHFNEHMTSVLSVLDYSNLERIWIERTETTVREGRRSVERSTFDLHIVRQTESGESYEDTIDHLSESEREVTGLVFALAGYLVHDVYDVVPFMLLDSLEAIDAERIARLVDYVAEYAEHLVVALLPEDAAALSDDYQRVSDI